MCRGCDSGGINDSGINGSVSSCVEDVMVVVLVVVAVLGVVLVVVVISIKNVVV